MQEEKTGGEEQVLSSEEFMRNVQTAAGVEEEPTIPDGATDDQKRIAALENDNALMKFQMGVDNVIKAFKSKFPKATESQMQQVVGAYYEGNPIGIFDGIANAVQTTTEKDSDDEGTQDFEVEDESSDDQQMDENYIPGSMTEAIDMITGDYV